MVDQNIRAGIPHLLIILHPARWGCLISSSSRLFFSSYPPPPPDSLIPKNPLEPHDLPPTLLFLFFLLPPPTYTPTA